MILNKSEIKRLSKSELTQDDIEYFKNRFGNRFVRALRAVEEGKVLKYNFSPSDTHTWIVKGTKREYLVIPDIFCTGRDFYQSVVISRDATTCYHLLAQQIAEIRNSYKVIKATDAERRHLFVKWRKTN
jgi:predicted nucleic acid-binding Zn finger protein